MLQNALAQQGKSSPAKHRAFDVFYPGDLTFHLAIAMNERESCQDSRFVSLKTVGKTLEFLDINGLDLAQLGVEA